MIQIHQVPKEIWPQLAQKAHKSIFGEALPSSQTKIDFTLLAVDPETQTPQGYVTCKELDDKTLNWSFGGAFPPARGHRAWTCFHELIRKTKELGYKRVFFIVENKNSPMLKFAATAGAVIIGARILDSKCWLEHLMELS